MNKLFFYAFSALLAGGTALSVVSCADNDLDNSRTNGNDALVRFNVNDVQEGAISRGVMTRGAITPGLGSNDLAGGKLVAHSNRNIDVCLIEATVEGVNPVKADAHTCRDYHNLYPWRLLYLRYTWYSSFRHSHHARVVPC